MSLAPPLAGLPGRRGVSSSPHEGIPSGHYAVPAQDPAVVEPERIETQIQSASCAPQTSVTELFSHGTTPFPPSEPVPPRRVWRPNSPCCRPRGPRQARLQWLCHMVALPNLPPCPTLTRAGRTRNSNSVPLAYARGPNRSTALPRPLPGGREQGQRKVILGIRQEQIVRKTTRSRPNIFSMRGSGRRVRPARRRLCSRKRMQVFRRGRRPARRRAAGHEAVSTPVRAVRGQRGFRRGNRKSQRDPSRSPATGCLQARQRCAPRNSGWPQLEQ